MRRVLITGFEPFGGERINPSWEVVKQMNDLMMGASELWRASYPAHSVRH